MTTAAPAAWGAVCAVKQGEDNKYGYGTFTVTQQELAGIFPDPTALDDNYLGGELIGIGPFEITPFVDMNAKQVGVSISILGIGIGTYYISFAKGGLDVTVNLKAAKGTISFTIHDGYLWVHYDISILGKHTTGSEHKVIKIPGL